MKLFNLEFLYMIEFTSHSIIIKIADVKELNKVLFGFEEGRRTLLK